VIGIDQPSAGWSDTHAGAFVGCGATTIPNIAFATSGDRCAFTDTHAGAGAYSAT
jgi:hypothetical protein